MRLRIIAIYTSHYDLPVNTENGVNWRKRWTYERLAGQFDGGRHIVALRVAVAVFAFHQSITPMITTKFGSAATQLTPKSYHNRCNVPTGTVLVIADGASGHDTTLALVNLKCSACWRTCITFSKLYILVQPDCRL